MTSPRSAKERGIASSAEHAGSAWCEKARTFVGWFFRAHPIGSYTMEQVRTWAYQHGLERSPEDRSWGAVTRSAIRDAVMVRTGHYAAADSSNGAAKPLYQRVALVPLPQQSENAK